MSLALARRLRSSRQLWTLLTKVSPVTCSSPQNALPSFLATRSSPSSSVVATVADLVLLFMNDHALKSLLGDKFKLGADASVAAGPVGRTAAAATDLRLNSEILSYSRTKGLFAGVSLDGAVVQADRSGDRSMYGANVDRHEILSGKIATPPSARGLSRELNAYGDRDNVAAR